MYTNSFTLIHKFTSCKPDFANEVINNNHDTVGYLPVNVQYRILISREILGDRAFQRENRKYNRKAAYVHICIVCG